MNHPMHGPFTRSFSRMNGPAVVSRDAPGSDARTRGSALGTMKRPDNGSGSRCQTFLCSLG